MARRRYTIGELLDLFEQDQVELDRQAVGRSGPSIEIWVLRLAYRALECIMPELTAEDLVRQACTYADIDPGTILAEGEDER